MKRGPTETQLGMTDAQLDSALLSESDALLPSSGFTDSVMAAVREEAMAPPPIPFPWKRALPGMAAVVLAVCGFLAGLISALSHSQASSHMSIQSFNLLPSLIHQTSATDTGYLLLALVITALSLALPWSLSRSR
jgi:hypothetical protein